MLAENDKLTIYLSSYLRASLLYMSSPAYFVAYQFVLSALRRPETLSSNPLSPVIITETAANDTPNYIGEEEGIDLRPILKDDYQDESYWNPMRDGDIQDFIGGMAMTKLDASQLEAIQHCLSHRVSLVVGPPGKKICRGEL